MFDDRSVNYNIPIPNVANTLSVDIGRLREAIALIDGLFKTNTDLRAALIAGGNPYGSDGSGNPTIDQPKAPRY